MMAAARTVADERRLFMFLVDVVNVWELEVHF
jgi:hypothetical protein